VTCSFLAKPSFESRVHSAKGSLVPTERRTWSQNELLVVFRLYCRTPFGRLHQRNPEIIGLAHLIDRTPSAVAMKACNFASLDPQQQVRSIQGLGNVSRADRELWEAFRRDSEAIAHAAETANTALFGEKPEQDVQEFALPEGPTEKEMIVKARRVQSFFRAAVISSYDNRCALTDLAIPELLNASHIIPWRVDRTRRADPRNGICLNVLHDRAFDRGLITFDEDFRMVVSPLLSCSENSEFQRRVFTATAGRKIRLPVRFLPDEEAIAYHRQRVFRES